MKRTITFKIIIRIPGQAGTLGGAMVWFFAPVRKNQTRAGEGGTHYSLNTLNSDTHTLHTTLDYGTRYFHCGTTLLTQYTR